MQQRELSFSLGIAFSYLCLSFQPCVLFIPFTSCCDHTTSEDRWRRVSCVYTACELHISLWPLCMHSIWARQSKHLTILCWNTGGGEGSTSHNHSNNTASHVENTFNAYLMNMCSFNGADFFSHPNLPYSCVNCAWWHINTAFSTNTSCF